MELDGKMSLEELISSVRAGDDGAFEVLLNAYKPMIESVIHRYSLDARDSFSEACMGFYRAIFSYELGQSEVTFGLYAKICVERALIDMHRREGRATSHYIDSDVDVESIAVPGGIQAMLEHREQTAYYLAVAKESLSSLELDVYRCWMLGYTTSEISERLGMSAKAVDNAKNRMWRKLRERLSSKEREDSGPSESEDDSGEE